VRRPRFDQKESDEGGNLRRTNRHETQRNDGSQQMRNALVGGLVTVLLALPASAEVYRDIKIISRGPNLYEVTNAAFPMQVFIITKDCDATLATETTVIVNTTSNKISFVPIPPFPKCDINMIVQKIR
jgi:hypothetical protein